MFLHRLLYRSNAAFVDPRDRDEQLAEIVRASRRANAGAGLSGALLLHADVFIQALEGPIDVVEGTFERICGDLRHRRVRLLQLAVIDDRMFGDWSMAAVTPSAELARLCPILDAAPSIRLDSSMASMALQMMRDLLVARAGGEGGSEFC